MVYRGYHDGDPTRPSAQKLAAAVKVYRQDAEDDPAVRARFGDEPTFVLTSLPDAEAVLAAGTPLDVRGSGQIMSGCFYLNNRPHGGA